MIKNQILAVVAFVLFSTLSLDLEGEETIILNLYQVDYRDISVQEVPVHVSDGKFIGSFTTDASTKALFFGVNSEDMERADNNDEKGYKTVV